MEKNNREKNRAILVTFILGIISFLILLVLIRYTKAEIGPQYHLAWDPNPPEEAVEGYKIYWRYDNETEAYDGTRSMDVGRVYLYRIIDLEGLYSTVIEAEEMQHSTGGMHGPDAWNLWGNGELWEDHYFHGVFCTVEIRARGQLANGIGPEMELMIDNETIGKVFVNNIDYQVFEFLEVNISEGDHRITIRYQNDLYDPDNGLDRNLIVDKIIIIHQTPFNTEADKVWFVATAYDGYQHESSFSQEAILDTVPDIPPEKPIIRKEGQNIVWDLNTEPDFSHYIFHVRIENGDYIVHINIGKDTVITDSQIRMLQLTAGLNYLFSITAVDTAGLESDHSNEILEAPPSPPVLKIEEIK